MFLKIWQVSYENTCAGVSLQKILRTPFFTEHLRWLLLKNALEGFQFTVYSMTSMFKLTLSKVLLEVNRTKKFQIVSIFVANSLYKTGSFQIFTGLLFKTYH